jgi:HSP20 family protein
VARTQVSRWDPFRDLMSLRDFARLFGDGDAGGEANGRGSWSPFLDVYETPDSFVVKADLPGMTSDDVEVTLDQNLLTIRGERKSEEEVKEKNFHRIERRYGSFERTVLLPAQVNPDGIQANFTNGVLEVIVPKSEQAKPHKIKIGETRQLKS